jgi:hypothetical protein
LLQDSPEKWYVVVELKSLVASSDPAQLKPVSASVSSANWNLNDARSLGGSVAGPSAQPPTI